MGLSWADVVNDAIRICEEAGAKVLVVDTLGLWAGIPDDMENAAGTAQAAMAPLLRAAGLGLAVLVLRHDRKGGGEVGESARGSSAFGGAVDIILNLRRSSDPNNKDPNLRELHALSRFDETPAQITVRLGADGAFTRIDPDAERENQAEARLLSAMPRNEGDAVPTAELLKSAGVGRTAGHELVERLHKEGRINRTGEGKRKDPFRYWIPSADQDRVSSADSSAAPTGPRTNCPSEHIVRGANPLGADERFPKGFISSADSSAGLKSGGRISDRANVLSLAALLEYPLVDLGDGATVLAGEQPWGRFLQSASPEHIKRALEKLEAIGSAPA
jgi:hypothetical protein